MGTTARNSALYLNGFNLSGYFRSFDVTDDCGLEDTTVWGASVVGKSWTPTLMESKMAYGGFWDPTLVTGPNAAVRAAIALATTPVLCHWPIGDAVGNPGFAMAARVANRKVSGSVDGVLSLEMELQSNVGDEDVISLHSTSAAETLDGNGTTVDNGAATTSGGAIYLQSNLVATNNIVTVRHSTDNFVGSDVLLGTFATVSADYKAERIAISGTINRYVRCVWNLTGDATFQVAIHRR